MHASIAFITHARTVCVADLTGITLGGVTTSHCCVSTAVGWRRHRLAILILGGCQRSGDAAARINGCGMMITGVAVVSVDFDLEFGIPKIKVIIASEVVFRIVCEPTREALFQHVGVGRHLARRIPVESWGAKCGP
jgi:hypothetical protein